MAGGPKPLWTQPLLGWYYGDGLRNSQILSTTFQRPASSKPQERWAVRVVWKDHQVAQPRALSHRHMPGLHCPTQKQQPQIEMRG